MAKPGIQAEEPVFTFTLDDFLNNKEFVDNEIVLTVEGRGANHTTYTHVEEIVRKTAKLSEEEKVEEQFSCYRLEVPNRWYSRCKNEELVEKLNNQTTKGRITGEGSELTFRFQKKSDEVTRVRILWVPPNLQLGAIKRLAETVFGPEVTVTRPEERRDLSRGGLERRGIYHTISHKRKSTSMENRKKHLSWCLSREDGRGATTVIPLAKPVFQQDEPEDGEDSGEASGNVVTGISYARMAGTRRAAPQPSPPQGTKATPAATAPKAKPANKIITKEKSTPLPSPKRTESPDKPSPPPKPARDSPASPPPEKTKTEKKEEPVEIPAERKDKGQSPKKKSPKSLKKTATAEIMREELEAVKRKVQSKKNPSLVGMYTHGPGKRKAGESLETEKKQETKTRRGSRSRSRTRDGTTKESPTK